VDIDLSPLLGDLTAVSAVIVVLYLAFRAVKPFIERAVDNFDQMSKGYLGYTKAQVDMASAVRELCREVRDGRTQERERDDEAAQERAEIIKALGELSTEVIKALGELSNVVLEQSGVMRGIQQQQQTNEGRSAARHQEYLKQSREILAAWKKMNGKNG
jgi:hypothetical protein